MINITLHDFIVFFVGSIFGFLGFALALAKDDLIKLYKEYREPKPLLKKPKPLPKKTVRR
jgi:hypothetical protein